MKGWLRLAVFSIGVMLAACGIKDVHVHFEQLRAAHSPHPRGLQGNRSLNLSPEFHQENTVTNVLSAEEEEEDDYLDFEKLLSEDDDYSDVIDAVPETMSDFKRGNVVELFHGKTRIQRLNLFNANFAFDLYRSMKDKANATENILLAPVGISTAMAMVSLGLRGETREEVLDSLGFTEFVNASSKYDAVTIHNIFHKLIHRLFRRNFGYTLRSVNDLYIERQFPVPSEFKNNMKNYYFAEAQTADFADPNFIAKANERILKITKGLIKEALVHVHPSTVMMILNCLYFKGKITF